MENANLILLKKFIDNTCTPDELALVEQLIKNGIDEALWLQLMLDIGTDPTSAILSQRHRNELYTSIDKKIDVYSTRNTIFLNRQKWLSGLAACLLLLFIADVTFSWINDTSIAFVSSTRNEGKHVETTDGTHIWINNYSILRYPEEFSTDTRSVELEGEAFFNVAHEVDRPFIITTGNIRVRVLGTSFNVKAYKEDNEIVVTLSSGKVQVKCNDWQYEISPGQQFQYNKKSGKVAVLQTDPSEASAWKDGWLVFNSTRLEDIVKTLKREYGVEIVLEDASLKDIRVTVKRKDASLTNVLDIISFTAGVAYTIDGKIVSIKAKK